jgi:ABC-type sulfate transport system substrate-binding protein
MFKNKKKEREYIKKVFSDLVDENTVNLLQKENKVTLNHFKEGYISFIFFQVNEKKIEKVPTLIKQSIEIVIKNDGIVGDILSSFVAVFFRIEDDYKNEKSKQLIQDLIEQLGENIRIVYGKSIGFVGNLGSKECLKYGPVIPNISLLFQKLIELDYGTSVEVKEYAS